jgi:hypothetical protein
VQEIAFQLAVPFKSVGFEIHHSTDHSPRSLHSELSCFLFSPPLESQGVYVNSVHFWLLRSQGIFHWSLLPWLCCLLPVMWIICLFTVSRVSGSFFVSTITIFLIHFHLLFILCSFWYKNELHN